MTPDSTTWNAWLGRTERRVDLVGAAPLAALAATLDRDDPEPVPGSDVPPLWHWLYFTQRALQRSLGPDGHAARGEFLPPVPLPRRMWAGGRLEFNHPLRVGDEITRQSRIVDVRSKEGRSGSLVFVVVRHEIANALGVAIGEEHDIVFREFPGRGGTDVSEAVAAPRDEAFSREIIPDPVLLFRYSALTFNSHRIHYDRSYVREVEGYPGLIVHGPLIATLLADLLRREQPTAQLKRFAFRALRPLFDLNRFSVCGRPDGGQRYALWARGHSGALAMEATAELA